MATASFSVSITATAGTPEQAQVLRLAGLRRFVRTTTPRVTAGMLDGGESTEEVDPQTLDEAALLPLAEAALQRFVRECIVAQGEAQAQALSVVAEVIP